MIRDNAAMIVCGYAVRENAATIIGVYATIRCCDNYLCFFLSLRYLRVILVSCSMGRMSMDIHSHHVGGSGGSRGGAGWGIAPPKILKDAILIDFD